MYNKEKIFYKDVNISKSGIDNYNINERISNSKLKYKEKKINKIDKKYYFSNNNIQLNKEKNNNGNNVQRYFKIQTRNNIKKHISLNQNKKLNDIKNDEKKENEINNNSYTKLNPQNNIKERILHRNNTISMNIKKFNNNYYDFINDINNKSLKLTTNNNFTKKRNYNNIRFNINLLEDNKNYFDYLTGSISCKNEKIDKNLETFPKKFGSNNNVSVNELLDMDNKYKIITPHIRKINNNLDKNYNLKYSKKLNENKKDLSSKSNSNKILYLKEDFINNNNNQSFSIKNINYNFQKFLVTNDNKIIKNDYYSPRNKEIKFMKKDKNNNKKEKENKNYNIYNSSIIDKRNNMSTKNRNYNFLIEF